MAISIYTATETVCEWFAMCLNPATTTQPHPALGPVPICDRCKAEADRDRWKERALNAEAQLRAIERRALSMIFAPPHPSDFDE